MTSVIVGAGPTGVEIAGQLAALARDMRQEFHPAETARADRHRLHSENGAIVHLAAQPDKLHLFSISTGLRLTA